MPVVFEYVAQTQSSRQVNIQARVNGFLDKRVYTEGAIVKAGQVLFQMDQKPFQAQVDRRKAALAAAAGGAGQLRARTSRAIKPLAAQNALSQKDLDDATGQYQQSAAAVAQAKAQVGAGEAQSLLLHDHLAGRRHLQLRAAGRRHLHQHVEQPAHDRRGARRRCG